MTTLWDTTGTEVVKALAAERRSAGALAFGLALTLVVVTDQQSVAEAEQAATAAAAAHPCRILIVIRRHLEAPESRLDAEVLIGGRLGPGEAVVMRMYGRLGLHAESVVLPLLAPDAPVVTWWHDCPPERIAYDPLGIFADRRVTDVVQCDDPLGALRQRAHDYAPGDTDLAWTRTTGWRSLLAAAFDGMVGTATKATVTAPQMPRTALLIGWLKAKLGIPVEHVEQRGRDISEVVVDVMCPSGPEHLVLRRRDDRSAVMSWGGRAERVQPLAARDLGDLLAEELRRLDADEVYAEALSAWAGVPGLDERPSVRHHIWYDPTQPAAQQDEDAPEPRAGQATGPAAEESHEPAADPATGPTSDQATGPAAEEATEPAAEESREPDAPARPARPRTPPEAARKASQDAPARLAGDGDG